MIIEYAGNHPAYSSIGASFSDPNFKDVHSADWFYNYVKEAKGKGYISGYSDNTFRPNICVNRAEAMKIARNVLLSNEPLDTSVSPVTYGGSTLVSDIDQNSWYSPYARALFKYKLVGIDHTINDLNFTNAIKYFPSVSMSRKEVAEMLHRISVSILNPTTTSPAPTSKSGLEAPILLSPANDPDDSHPIPSTTPTVNFSWSPVSGVDSYELIISSEAVSAPVDWGNLPLVKNINVGTATQYQVVTSTLPTPYEGTDNRLTWYVIAHGKNGASATSDFDNFSIAVPPRGLGNPELNVPANDQVFPASVSLPINFSWSDDLQASYYDLMIRSAQSNTYFLTQRTDTYTFSYTMSGTSKDYYWKVRAFDAQGNWKESTENHFSFGATSTLGTPALGDPANGKSIDVGNPFGLVTSTYVSWPETPGAVRYDIMFRFGSSTAPYKTYPINYTDLNGLGFFIPDADFPIIASGQSYNVYWKVRAYGVNNNYSDSPEWKFTIMNSYTS